MADPLDDNLIFIISTPRAGSTLLGAMLASHSAMHCPPEPWLLLLLSTMRSDAVRAQAPYGYEMARDALRQLADDELFAQGCRALVDTLYTRLLERAHKRIFIDKTPRYFHILPQLTHLFPRARQIWINRNPLDVLASLKDTWGFAVDELLGEVLSPYSFDATLGPRWLADHFDHPAPTKAIVRYEDLVTDPETHLRRLCEFLAVPFEPAMLNYGENRSLVNQYAAGTMGDKKILGHARPHAQSLDRWKTTLTPDELSRIVRVLGPSIFQRLGYESAFAQACALADVPVESISPDGQLQRLLEQYGAYQGTEKLAHELSRCEEDRAQRLELIQTLTARIDDIESDRQQRLEAIESLVQERDHLRGQFATLAEQHSAQAQTLQRQSEQIARIEADRADRLRLIERQAARIEEIDADRAQRLALLESSDAQLRQLQDDHQALARQHEALVRQHHAITAQREELDHQRAQLRQALDEMTRRARQSESDLHRAHAALDSQAARALRRLKLIHYDPSDNTP